MHTNKEKCHSQLMIHDSIKPRTRQILQTNFHTYDHLSGVKYHQQSWVSRKMVYILYMKKKNNNKKCVDRYNKGGAGAVSDASQNYVEANDHKYKKLKRNYRRKNSSVQCVQLRIESQTTRIIRRCRFLPRPSTSLGTERSIARTM